MNDKIDGDTGESCQSPYHNPNTCEICKEQEKYKDVTYCPECDCYYDVDGSSVKQPNWAECRSEICKVCRECAEED
jgi:hypothetical protein